MHGHFILRGETAKDALLAISDMDHVPPDEVGAKLLMDESAGQDLVRGGRGERFAFTDETRQPFGAEIGLILQPGRKGPPVESGPVPQHQSLNRGRAHRRPTPS
jgi:hypothetical protein